MFILVQCPHLPSQFSDVHGLHGLFLCVCVCVCVHVYVCEIDGQTVQEDQTMENKNMFF